MRSSSRRWLWIVVLGPLALAVGAIGVEQMLEMRDARRLTADQTFASVEGRRIRYRLTGQDHQGPTVVLLSGISGSIEQWDNVQDEISRGSPVVSYDRGGVGFSDPAPNHDAAAQAEELDGLLHALPAPPPYVIVSFSVAASLARVFATVHRSETAGLVFLDPAPESAKLMPNGKYYSYQRDFARTMLVTNIESLVGYRRLLYAFMKAPPDHEAGSPSPASYARSSAILMSFHHWLGTARELLAMKRSDEEATAAPSFGSLPLVVFSSYDPAQNEVCQFIVACHRELAAKSSRGVLRMMEHGAHERMLTNPALSRPVVETIREVVDEGTAGAAQR